MYIFFSFGENMHYILMEGILWET